MMQITIPKSNDFRRFFNPVILILMSIVLNTFFQLYTSEEEWNSFFIFNQKPDYTVFFISLVFYLFFLFGAFFAYLFNYQKHSNHRSHYLYNFSFYNGLLKFVFYSNVISLIVTQYYMHEANIYNIYISGGVSAQTIESQIASSPLGIHGISVMLGYFGIIMYGISRLIKDNRAIVFISILVIIIKFISYAKLQSLLYVLLALMLFSRRRISINKGVVIGGVVIFLFSFTRIIRNPEQNLSLSFDFLFRFVGGFYFGSPVVNFNYVIQNNIQDVFYFFNWFLPQKIIPASPISLEFPDVTSPIGFVGSAYVSLGIFSVIYAYLVGFIIQLIYLQRNTSPFAFVFQPFVTMACIFAMMYNNFVNMIFFILPLIFSYLVVIKTICARKEDV